MLEGGTHVVHTQGKSGYIIAKRFVPPFTPTLMPPPRPQYCPRSSFTPVRGVTKDREVLENFLSGCTEDDLGNNARLSIKKRHTLSTPPPSSPAHLETPRAVCREQLDC